MKRLFTISILSLLLFAEGMAQEPAAAPSGRELELADDWGSLRGTLLVPAGGSETAVILLAGSGPTDRNGDSPAGLRTGSYALLARALADAGFASLRYDKRGVAASWYRDPEQRLADCRFGYYVDDALRWVERLHAEGFGRVVLAGHSEGALLALLAAERDPRGVAAVVSLCGAGCPGDELLRVQLAAQLSGYDPALWFAAERIIRTLKRGETPKDVPEPLAALFPAYLNGFWTEWMGHDPRRILAGLTCPVLIVGGGNDCQVPPDNARELHRVRPSARMEIIPGMTHTLKPGAGHSAAEQIDAYTDPSLPLAEGLADLVAEFLRGLDR